MKNSNLLDELKKIVGERAIIKGNDLAGRYYHIWKMDEPFDIQALIMPRSTEEISKICKLCNAHKQSIVVFGGLTNLVGGTKINKADIVISLEKLNKIEEVDVFNRSMTVQAGVILEIVQNAAIEKGLLFPLNFGAKGNAQIGGCISTNAGGLRVLKYGMTRQLVLGLEAVMADGTIISSLKKLGKDNSGYDLKQLFIGTEGTLGIVTRAVLKLQELPSTRNSAFCGFNDFDKIVQFLKLSSKYLGSNLSGFELMWQNAYVKITSPPSLLKAPLSQEYKYFVLIESLGNNPENDYLNMQKLLEEALIDELMEDGAMASSDSDLNWFWNIREDVGILDNACDASQHFDISLPILSINDYVDNVQEQLNDELGITECYTFGHLADGNIHFIIGKENNSMELKNQIDSIVYSPLEKLNGSVSAEHGIGIDKKAWLYVSKSPSEIKLMKLLKKTLDPNNILNPGRIIDLE